MLSSLFGGIKNIASSISSGFSKFNNFLTGGGTASAKMNFPLLPNIGSDFKPLNQTPLPNQTVAPTATNPGGPGRGNVSFNNPSFVASQNLALQQVQQTSAIRPSTYPTSSFTPPTDEFGRTSSKQQGTPYIKDGQLITPKTGFGGITGFGGSGFSNAVTTPQTGFQGASGVDNARGFRSVGQGTTSGLFGQQESDEEKRKKDGGTQTVTSPTDSALNSLIANGAPDPTGSPQVPEIFDAAEMQSMLNNVAQTINETAGSAYSEADKQSIYAQLQQNLMAAKIKLDQASPIPEQPVVDTPEQLEFINQSEDPFGAQQMIDEIKATQTNLAQKETRLMDLNNTITALTDAYKPIINDIKENPNMPKALARRKIEGLAFTQREALTGLLRAKETLTEEIGNENMKVNRALQIYQIASNEENRRRDDARAMLSLYTSNPHLLMGMSDTELKQEAANLGIKYSGLKNLQDQAMNPKADIGERVRADGTLEGYDTTTGKTIWTRPGFGSSEGTTPTSQFTNTQLNKGANRAGVDVPIFQAFEPEVQNYFISSSESQITAVKDVLKQVSSGKIKQQKALEWVNSSVSLTPATKDYFKNQITSLAPAEQPKDSWWTKVKNFFTQ